MFAANDVAGASMSCRTPKSYNRPLMRYATGSYLRFLPGKVGESGLNVPSQNTCVQYEHRVPLCRIDFAPQMKRAGPRGRLSETARMRVLVNANRVVEPDVPVLPPIARQNRVEVLIEILAVLEERLPE